MADKDKNLLATMGKVAKGFQLIPGDTDILKKDGRFLCNVKFLNELPEIPCDPKMLVSQLNVQELAKFHLTALEQETKHDLLFQTDLGIAIRPLDIERFSIPANPGPLDPKDAALIGAATTAAAAGRITNNMPYARRKQTTAGDSAEANWLLRTTYITNELVEAAKKPGGVVSAIATKVEEAPVDLSKEDKIAAIEKSFQDATKPPVHQKKPHLHPVEILPVVPDDLLVDWSCVLAAFDGNPTDGVDRLETLSETQQKRAGQNAQLKSYSRKKQDGTTEKFVAFMLPMDVPSDEAATAAPQYYKEADAAIEMPAAAVQGDYEWVREYNSQVKFDDKEETYLFRFGNKQVTFQDLNTKLALKKRKRQRADEEDPFLQPEKFILRLPGTIREEEENNDDEDGAMEEQQQQEQQDQEQPPAGGHAYLTVNTGPDPTAAAAAPVNTADVMRDVFGSDDDE